MSCCARGAGGDVPRLFDAVLELDYVDFCRPPKGEKAMKKPPFSEGQIMHGLG
jgi:hypothetical protein